MDKKWIIAKFYLKLMEYKTNHKSDFFKKIYKYISKNNMFDLVSYRKYWAIRALILYWQESSVQFSRSVVSDSATPWIAARQASLSITNSWSWLRLMSIESVMPSSHLILCRPLLLLPPIPPSIRVFSNESTLRIMWPKYWGFSFSIIPYMCL